MEAKVRSLTSAQRAALSRIEGLMEYWRISTEEIEQAPEPLPVRRGQNIKYRHPKTGETWDGEGPHPEWLRRALLQEGYLVSELDPAQTFATSIN